MAAILNGDTPVIYECPKCGHTEVEEEVAVRCIQCIRRQLHYFHDNGTQVEGWLKADPNCDQCHLGVEHTVHDRKAFNTNKAYDGG